MQNKFVCLSLAIMIKYSSVILETQDDPQGDANLQLWDLQTGNCIKALYQKKAEGW